MATEKLIYLAAPLFTIAERMFNEELCRLLTNRGFLVYLPQALDGDHVTFEQIRENCIKGVRESDWIVAMVDGPDVDSGVAYELGYAAAIGKGRSTLIVRTDFRSSGDDGDGLGNIMLTQGDGQVLVVDSREGLIADVADGITAIINGTPEVQ